MARRKINSGLECEVDLMALVGGRGLGGGELSGRALYGQYTAADRHIHTGSQSLGDRLGHRWPVHRSTGLRPGRHPVGCRPAPPSNPRLHRLPKHRDHMSWRNFELLTGRASADVATNSKKPTALIWCSPRNARSY